MDFRGTFREHLRVSNEDRISELGAGAHFRVFVS